MDILEQKCGRGVQGNNGQLGNNTLNITGSPTSVSLAMSLKMPQETGGSDHFIGIDPNTGLLWGWGNNNSGQLGDNSRTNRSLPVSVSSADSFVQISVGGYLSMAIRGSDGRLFAWGLNDYGQLGQNSLTSRSVPVSVNTTDSFIAVAVGGNHAMALRGDGRLFAIGGSGGEGRLGNNNTVSRSTPVSCNNTSSYVQITAGSDFSGALRSDGLIYTWGDNTAGGLGDNSRTHRSVPVSWSSADSFIQISNKFRGIIGLRADGMVFTCGANEYGQGGDGTHVSRSIPTQIFGTHSFKKVAAGGSNTVRGLKSDGTIWSWGWNSYGHLGHRHDISYTGGQYTTSYSAPISVYTGDIGLNVSKIAVCLDASIILNSSGQLWSWGNNSYGQLGDNTRTSAYIPISVSTTDTFVDIGGGLYFQVAIRNDGLIYAWGRNDNGQLGENSTTSRSVPVSVSTASSFVKICYGYAAHMVAIRSDGLLYAWGLNDYGQLGDNSRTARSVPVSVSTASSWVDVKLGNQRTVALRSDGKIYSWGYNAYGEVGDNSITSRSVPVSVSLGGSYSQIGSGHFHAIAIDGSTGLLYAWGLNTSRSIRKQFKN